jgi:nucleotidyltransferase substrate binding protein (TIGR01987 family)
VDELDLTSLTTVVQALQRAAAVAATYDHQADADPAVVELIHAGLIQHFEFAYDVAWKFMKRWLEQNVSPQITDGIPRIELFRLAAEHRLIAATAVPQWMIFHRARNLSSHSYNPITAAEVYAVAQQFAEPAEAFLHTLRHRVADTADSENAVAE